MVRTNLIKYNMYGIFGLVLGFNVPKGPCSVEISFQQVLGFLAKAISNKYDEVYVPSYINRRFPLTQFSVPFHFLFGWLLSN